MKRCDRCRFWIKVKEGDVPGDCRRHTPIPHIMKAMNPLTNEIGVVVNSYFFKMNPDLWCGEYRRKPRLIPFCRNHIGRAIEFLKKKRGGKVGWYGVIASGVLRGKGGKVKVLSTDGKEECLTKEELINMSRSAGPNRGSSLN